MTVSTHDEATDALASFAELPQWLAAPMLPGRLEQSLRRHVPELGGGTLDLVSCRADQLRAKDDQWLARCRVVVAPAGGGPQEQREVVLVGLLHHPGLADPDPLPAGGSAFGEPGYRLWLPDLRLDLSQEEADPGLPSLGDLTDPEASARLIESMLRESGHRDAQIAVSQPTVARYKPGSRCTIVYEVTYDPPSQTLPNPVIAKTHQGDKGAFAHQAMAALWDTPLSEGRHVLIAEPLGYRADDRILLQGPVPEEQTLKELCTRAFETADPDLLDELRVQLGHTSRALAALHTSGAEYPRTVTVAEWMAETREVVDRLGHTVPELPRWAAPVIARLADVDAATPADPLVSSHHDFRPAQVLLSAKGLAFIDFDGAAMAEPGLDIGRFRGKLRDIGVTALAARPEGYRPDLLNERLVLLDDFCDRFLTDYQAHAPVSTERVLLWEAIDLFMALLHTWTKVRLLRVQPRLAILLHHLEALPRPRY